MISTNVPREEYIGTGLLTDYTFDFKVIKGEHLIVVQVDDLGAEVFTVRGDDTTYLDSVDWDPEAGGGTVSLLSALPLDHRLSIILGNDTPIQESEFRDKGSFTLGRIETALDTIVTAVQRLAYLAKRTPVMTELQPIAETSAFNYDIPSPVGNAGKTLALNSTEDGFEWV